MYIGGFKLLKLDKTVTSLVGRIAGLMSLENRVQISW